MQRYDVERAARSGRSHPDTYGERDEENRSGYYHGREDENRYAGSEDYPQYAEGYQRYPGDFQRGAYRRDPPDTGHSAWHQHPPSPRRSAWHQYDEPAESSWHGGERDQDESAPYPSPAYGSPHLSEQRIAHYGYGDEFRRYGRNILSAGRGDTRDLRHRADWHSAAQHERYDSSRYSGRRYDAAGPYAQAGAHAYGHEDGDAIDAYGGSVGDFDELPLSRAGDRSGSLYEDPSRTSQRGRGPKNYARSDERIREDVSEQLADDEAIDAGDILVEVSDGVVTLSGSVDTRRLKHRAEDIADRCSGVKDVQNRLTVKPQGAPGADSLLGQGAQAKAPGAAGSSAASGSSNESGTN
ncbi:BON domain-containing protein [Tahibacter harae]|uniref:BON domain-containing protein n=1 Tax=Tahibacter harae TaxID=2963937 RepID=A0ABT1QS02_9GAMM|nr:BON domain-containing protein [Tahibacter harae]MCQ4165075.1 BON domain-containing protein [Tahibacter harae]